MKQVKKARELAAELQELLRKKAGQVFEKYGFDMGEITSSLKWKPLVLIIGNYSSGKSTFINELLERDVQRTGQAPTDDSFTVLTAPEESESEGDIPGPTVVADDNLPFTSLRRFGESFLSHFLIKKVKSPILQDIAIIDTPGMLDSVTEKDRGYDYLGVVGELAGLSDLIVLMFDPHKAGTIKETYHAIRKTLPAAVGEDRVVYVLNRIDECENVPDLVRAYGTLCWNLSQMTGRKDMPHIFITFSPVGREITPDLEVWVNEREELKKTIATAPRMRLFHILQEVDVKLREVSVVAEAMETFKNNFKKRLKSIWKTAAVAATGGFLFGDILMKLILGFPGTTLLESLLNGTFSISVLLWPSVWALVAMALTALYVQRFSFPRFVKETVDNIDSLCKIDSAYKGDLWNRVKGKVRSMIEKDARHLLWLPHGRFHRRLDDMINKDLKKMYEQVRTA